MTEDIKNPYAEMTVDVINTHLAQLKSVVESKKLDVTQFFGEPISSADQLKVDQHESLTSQVNTLSAAESAKNLTDNETIFAQATIDRVVKDIRAIDPDVPLESVLNSKFNNLEKISILGNVEGLVGHYQSKISTLRKAVTPKDGEVDQTTQSFSKPASTTVSAEDIVAKVVADYLPESQK